MVVALVTAVTRELNPLTNMIWFTSEGLVKFVPTPVTTVPFLAMLIVPTPAIGVTLYANGITYFLYMFSSRIEVNTSSV
jgi:hypothetical protein